MFSNRPLARACIHSRRIPAKLRLSLAAAVVSITASLAALAEAANVNVCADPDPPPWTYWVRDDDGKRTTKFIGFSVDVLDAAFARVGRGVRFVGNLPWARCLLLVE